MNFEALKAEAKELGFTFELQKWVADDYTLDENEKEHWHKEKCSALKVTYPLDYPRHADFIEIGNSLSLQRCLDEYHNRFEIQASDEKISQNTIDSIASLRECLVESGLYNAS